MKIKGKSIISLALAIVMALSLAACGNNGGSESGSGTGGYKTENPEYIYNAEFTDLGNSSSGSLSPRAFTSDGFYATSTEKTGENIPEGVTPEYEGQYDVYETRLYFVGFDGTRKPLASYAPIPAQENTENKTDFNSSSNLEGLIVGADGKLITIECVYSSWYDGPEGISSSSDEYWNNYKSVQSYFIRILDENGSELSVAPIENEEGSYINAYSLQADDSGNLLIPGEMTVRAIALDGSTAYTIQSENYIDNIIRLKDGRLGALNWGDTGMCLSILDSQTHSLGESIALPYDAYNLVSGGGDYDLYYTSGVNFFGYKTDTQESEKLLNWINCDVNSDEMSGINVNSEGQISCILNHWNESDQTSTVELVTLTKVPYDSVPHKETLTMASVYLDWNVHNQVIDFNRKNDQYRIEITDYSEYNTEDDYTAGYTKLTTEIMAGNMPDIMALNGLPYAQLAAKGLLEDLTPYIEADTAFSTDDFFSNVTDALKVGGKLYQVCPSFSISTVIGASSVVGDTPGWTYDEFDAALATMPEGCDALDKYVTRNDILLACVGMDMESYVDWTTGQCSFDRPEFVKLLEVANRCPASFDWNNYEYSQEDSAENRIAQGKQMLMQSSIYSFSDIQYYDVYFGGNSTYIGYPTSSGTGSMLNLSTGYAMTTSCSNKDAAWDFLRIFLTEDYQSTQYSLPTNINVYKEKLKEAMTPQYQTDSQGNYLLDENGDKIEQSQGGMGMSDGTVYEFYAITQDQADKLWNLVSTTTKVADYNTSITDIVSEQAEAYFAGQKTPEEVAKLIQSKVNIYVNEQR